MLTVTGDATGPTSEFLRFIAQSPVAGWIGHATEDAQAAGNGKLSLKLTHAARARDGTKVTGEYQFNGNELRFPGSSDPGAGQRPRLRSPNRTCARRTSRSTRWAGTAKIAISNVDGDVRICGLGHREPRHCCGSELDVPLLARLSGSTDWQFEFAARADACRLDAGKLR